MRLHPGRVGEQSGRHCQKFNTNVQVQINTTVETAVVAQDASAAVSEQANSRKDANNELEKEMKNLKD